MINMLRFLLLASLVACSLGKFIHSRTKHNDGKKKILFFLNLRTDDKVLDFLVHSIN